MGEGAARARPAPPYPEPDVNRLARASSIVGSVLVVVGLSKLHAVTADPPYDYTASFRLPWSLVFAGLVVVTAYAVGLPDVARRRRQVVAASVAAPVLAAGGVSVLQLALGAALLPRLVVFGSVLLLVPVNLATAALSARQRNADEEGDRVVVVGVDEDIHQLALELDTGAERPATVVAVLTPGEAGVAADGRRPLRRVVAELDASVVVLDREAQLDPTIVEQAAEVHAHGVRVRTLSLFYDEWLGKLPIGELERVSLMFDIGEIHRARYGRTKRVIDVAIALTALPVLVALVPVVLVGNLVANRGPLLYRQTRVGKGGRRFVLWKFRTMRPEGAGGDAPGGDRVAWTGHDDPRITPFGRLLRRFHLDELPQLWNIVRGDLSLVGPRPEQPGYVEELSTKLPFYDVRHLVQPGLTGWAQVKYGYAGSESDALEKLQYEFWYLRHQSLAVDLRILARTLRSVTLGRGR